MPLSRDTKLAPRTQTGGPTGPPVRFKRHSLTSQRLTCPPLYPSPQNSPRHGTQLTASILGCWFVILIIGVIAGNLIAHDGW